MSLMIVQKRSFFQEILVEFFGQVTEDLDLFKTKNSRLNRISKKKRLNNEGSQFREQIYLQLL